MHPSWVIAAKSLHLSGSRMMEPTEQKRKHLLCLPRVDFHTHFTDSGCKGSKELRHIKVLRSKSAFKQMLFYEPKGRLWFALIEVVFFLTKLNSSSIAASLQMFRRGQRNKDNEIKKWRKWETTEKLVSHETWIGGWGQWLGRTWEMVGLDKSKESGDKVSSYHLCAWHFVFQ